MIDARHACLPPLAVVLLACGAGGARVAIPPREGGASTGPVAFQTRLSHPLVLAGEAQELYLHVVLRAAAAEPATPRPGLALALVIDRSGSMASERKLEYAKSAAEQLVARLGPEDRFALESLLSAIAPEASGSYYYVDAPESVGHFLDQELEELTRVEAARDLAVLAQAEVVRNAVALDRAMQRKKQGDLAAAQETLAARYLDSRTQNELELHDVEVERTLLRMRQVMEELERTRNDARAGRQLELTTALQALGYGGN